MKNKHILSTILVLVLVASSLLLVACNAENFESKLKGKNYTVELYGSDSERVINFNESIDGIYKENLEWQVIATKEKEKVYVFKFNNVKDAKRFYDEDADDFGLFKDRSTTCVIVGTEQGVKDAK